MSNQSAYIDLNKTRTIKDGQSFVDNCPQGEYAVRRSYAKIPNQVEVPNLVAYQKDSYESFLNDSIDGVCKSIFPMYGLKKMIEVRYKGYHLEDGEYTEEQAKLQSRNFEKKVFLDLEVVWHKIDRENKEKPAKEVLLNPRKGVGTKKRRKKGEFDYEKYTFSKSVYFGTLPILSSRDNFIINGTNKIIMPQILKTAGSYFIRERLSLVDYWIGRIQPHKGNWIDFTLRWDQPQKTNPINIQFDRSGKGKGAKQDKLPVTTFLRALGVSVENLEMLFGSEERHIMATLNSADDPDNLPLSLFRLENAFDKTSSWADINNFKEEHIERAIRAIETRLFDPVRYSLEDFGRFQLNQKLSVFRRLEGNYLAEDLKDMDGKILFRKNTLMDGVLVEKIKLSSQDLDIHHEFTVKDGVLKGKQVNYITISVYTDERNPEDTTFRVLGPDHNQERGKGLDLIDILSTLSYIISLNVMKKKSLIDDIDHLENRRVRNIGELTREQFYNGILNVKTKTQQQLGSIQYDDLLRYEESKVRENFFIYFKGSLNTKPLNLEISKFFNTSELVQFMDQTNPISELSNKRKITSLGPRGLDRRWSGEKVRDVHHTHYGRVCPVETPEGANIGLIYALPTLTLIDDYGFLKTPYWTVSNGVVNIDDMVYLGPNDEYSSSFIIASSNTKRSADGTILEDNVISRRKGENIIAKRLDVTHIDVSPKQILSVSASCIPFIENDDASRVLMASNMQRQAVPLLRPQAPIVGTGMEWVVARDSSTVVKSNCDGKVTYVDAKRVLITSNEGKEEYHNLSVYENSNQGTSTRHRPIVKLGDTVKEGQLIADSSATDKGELALGQNVLIAFTTWYGYNFEDAIVVSERLVKEDVYTSVHIIEYTIECNDIKQGVEEFTRDVPYVNDMEVANLDENGIILVGTEIKENDILVGKTTPKAVSNYTPQQELVFTLLGKKVKSIKDSSLRVPNGVTGSVQKIVHLKRSLKDNKIQSRTQLAEDRWTSWSSAKVIEGVDLKDNVTEVVKVYIVQKRKIQEGDKMAGRHGNKGVISLVLPEEDMPFLEDGTPVDILLSPLGIPSRMNIGQVLEIHCGLAAKKLGINLATPVFEGISHDDLVELMKEANVDVSGKSDLYDGLTGEKFDGKVSIGIMYMLKLAHMVDDKIHSRSVGPYSLITQQPLGGKANKGGQRFGEMEVWALEAYGAAYTLKEILTVKSDDIFGRRKAYGNIIKQREVTESGTPEALSVLINELRGLSLNVTLEKEEREWFTNDDDFLEPGNRRRDMKQIEKEDNQKKDKVETSTEEVDKEKGE